MMYTSKDGLRGHTFHSLSLLSLRNRSVLQERSKTVKTTKELIEQRTSVKEKITINLS